jgi:hypothetical protein
MIQPEFARPRVIQNNEIKVKEAVSLTANLGSRWGLVVSVTPRTRFTSGERTLGAHYTGD